MTAPNPWADLVRQIKAEVLDDVPRGLSFFQATITAVEAVDANGRQYASFVWQGKTIRALVNRDLTLAVGSRVVVHLYDTDPVIAFRLTA